MNNKERLFLTQKCAEILNRVLIEIRALTWDWEPGNEKWIEELSDITHNLPRFMIGADDAGMDGVRESFINYAKRRWPTSDPLKTEYVAICDMDEATFAEQYRRTSWHWPEPHSAHA